MVRTGLPTDQYADRLLPGNTIDWVCFCPVTARNRLVTVDFDRRRLLPGGISLATAWLQRERRNKKERERERGRTSRPDPTLPSLDDPNPSLPSLAERRKRGRCLLSSPRCLSRGEEGGDIASF
ncbi:hypothetical protein BHE74_00026938 [Ensete ventricosum]|nr:hypothetical protein BHE74_00026938 [Ensete ventricosum]